MLDRCFEALDVCLVHLGDYPKTNSKTMPNLILPVIKCEWIHEVYDYGIYLLVDNKGNKQGELRCWDMSAYYGDFYGEDAAIFVASSNDLNLRLNALLEQSCQQERIGFRDYPDAQYVKPPSSFGEKFRASFSKWLR